MSNEDLKSVLEAKAINHYQQAKQVWERLKSLAVTQEQKAEVEVLRKAIYDLEQELFPLRSAHQST